MKNFKMNIFPVIIALGVVFLLSSCAQKMAFLNSSVVPGAEGSVAIDKDKNENYAIEVKIMNLADPKKLTPPKTTYVVWMNTERNEVKNIGQINSSTSLLSNTMKGDLKTVTSFKPISFFITAEDDPNIQYPGMQVVLRTTAE